LFDRGPFLRPDLPGAVTPRADAVKAGRRSARAAPSAVARPRLDGGEHGVILWAVGTRYHTRPANCRLNGCYALAINPAFTAAA
jgi:hypothetical protein